MSSLFPPSGPNLPAFQSLLITGPYHSSAPVHLLLSHVEQNFSQKAILFVPSRQVAINAIQDQWLNMNAGSGEICRRLSQVDVLSVLFSFVTRTFHVDGFAIRYPPTPAHLTLLMAMMHTFNETFHHSKTTFEIAPTLLVFYELSLYFLEGQHT